MLAKGAKFFTRFRVPLMQSQGSSKDSPTIGTKDRILDIGTADDSVSGMVCRAGGGDQSCASVTVCVTACSTDPTCLESCRDSLCTAHEEVYCAMHECIRDSCQALCDDMASADCLACVTLNCTAVTAACAAATNCQENR